MSIKFSFDDDKTWELFAEGKTKGVFQLESNLGKTWSKRLAPRNIEELAALISIIRPGSLNAKIDGKQVTQIYVDRKHGRDPVVYLHESLEEILSSTYGVIVYQEQAMLIAQKLAGFDLKEADVLRKAIGKKKADLMAETKTKFMEGCKKTQIVDQDTASEIFGWIEKSARYSFNKCLSPESIVITPEGCKSLKDINIGDLVLAPKDNDNNHDEFTTVLDVIDNGVKEVYEVELEDGKTITCTLDHKFLCSDGEKHTLYKIIHQNLEIMCID